ncbi:hypothetical protein EDC01DRAFT_122522 [Geopyxis carbonaria]|nr:hypothetical protein EDC01DRAFT_122522 [Geopyxis carbonaria]
MSSYPHNTEGYTINSPSEKVKDAVKNVLERVIQEESQRKEKEQEETKKILDARKKKDDESAKHVRLFFEQKGMSPDYIDQVLKLPQKEDEYSSDPRQTHRSNFTSKKTRFSILSWDPTESESVRSVSPTSTSSSSSTTASNSNASIHSSNTSVSLGPQDASETLETSPMLSVDNVFQSFWIQSYLLKPLVKATQVLPKGLGLKSTIDSWNLKYQDMGSDIILHKTLSLQEMNTIIEETFEKTSTVVSKFIICADALDESDLCYSEMVNNFEF